MKDNVCRMVIREVGMQGKPCRQNRIGWIGRKAAIIIGVALLCAGAIPLSAQTDDKDFPNQPIRVIVPNTPGGPPDMTVRIMAPKLSIALGQPIVVDNRAGAGGIIGAVAVANAKPDGYTWLFSAATQVKNPVFNKNANYDAIRDFTAVTMAAQNFGQAFLTHPSVPAKTVQELIAYAKQHPGKLTYGSAGVATASHIPAEIFKQMTSTDILAVQYKGAALAMNALLSGEIDILFVGPQTALPHIQSGKLRALAMTGSKRWKGLPDVPTLQECGLKGFNIVNWFGLWLPAGASPKIVTRIYTDVAKVLTEPDIIEQFDNLALEPVGLKPAEFSQFVAKDAVEIARIARMLKLQPK